MYCGGNEKYSNSGMEGTVHENNTSVFLQVGNKGRERRLVFHQPWLNLVAASLPQGLFSLVVDFGTGDRWILDPVLPAVPMREPIPEDKFGFEGSSFRGLYTVAITLARPDPASYDDGSSMKYKDIEINARIIQDVYPEALLPLHSQTDYFALDRTVLSSESACRLAGEVNRDIDIKLIRYPCHMVC